MSQRIQLPEDREQDFLQQLKAILDTHLPEESESILQSIEAQIQENKNDRSKPSN